MARKVEMSLDEEELMAEPQKHIIEKETKEVQEPQATRGRKRIVKPVEEEPVINPLRKERVIVRHINKPTGIVRDPRHILYGGIAETTYRYYTVPRLSTGNFVNVLTNSEKEFLEEAMGLEYNALSIYKKKDNYWSNNFVRVGKQDTYLDLSSPEDYIKYKILLANKDKVAPNLHTLEDRPKATYEFVIVRENDEANLNTTKMSATMQAYKDYGKIEMEYDKLRFIIETINGTPMSSNTKLVFLQDKIGKIIQSDPKLFVRTVEDPLLDTKVLLKQAVEAGVVSKRGNQYYLRDGGKPLCSDDQEPTLNIAASYLNLPKNQSLLLSIDTKVKQYKG